MQALSEVVRRARRATSASPNGRRSRSRRRSPCRASSASSPASRNIRCCWRRPEEKVIPLCAANGDLADRLVAAGAGRAVRQVRCRARKPPADSRASQRHAWAGSMQTWLQPDILEAVQKLKPLAAGGRLHAGAVRAGLGAARAERRLRHRRRQPARAARRERRRVRPGRRSRPLRQGRSDRGRRGARHLALAQAGRARAPAAKKHYVTAMAQLSDDCFAFGGPLLSVEDAVALLAARLGVVEGSEIVSTRRSRTAACWRGTSRRRCPCRPSPIPPSTAMRCAARTCRSARRRAFAVADSDPGRRCRRRAAAPGQAIRIFTGAPMPAGADTVFMQEDVRVEDDGKVVLPPGLKRGANVRPDRRGYRRRDRSC